MTEYSKAADRLIAFLKEDGHLLTQSNVYGLEDIISDLEGSHSDEVEFLQDQGLIKVTGYGTTLNKTQLGLK